MRIRRHHGSLDKSMETVQEIEPTLDAVKAYFWDNGNGMLPKEALDNITISYYMFDHRVKWNTYIVKCPDFGVLGMTDGPVDEAV